MSEQEQSEQGACLQCGSPSHAGHTADCPLSKGSDTQLSEDDALKEAEEVRRFAVDKRITRGAMAARRAEEADMSHEEVRARYADSSEKTYDAKGVERAVDRIMATGGESFEQPTAKEYGEAAQVIDADNNTKLSFEEAQKEARIIEQRAANNKAYTERPNPSKLYMGEQRDFAKIQYGEDGVEEMEREDASRGRSGRAKEILEKGQLSGKDYEKAQQDIEADDKREKDLKEKLKKIDEKKK